MGAALLLGGRIDGSAAAAMLLVSTARAAPPGVLLEAGAVAGAAARQCLTRQAQVAPVWVFLLAIAALRAGSVDLDAIRGANAVLGPALTHGGSASGIAGAWLALAGGLLAVAAPAYGRPRTAAPPGAAGVVPVPPRARGLEAVAVAAQVMLLVTLLAGPQVTGVRDAGLWAAVLALATAAVVATRRLLDRWRLPAAVPSAAVPLAAAGLAAAGLLLTLLGGRP